MAKLEQRPQVALDVTLRLSEAEARALLALTVYGEESFLRSFYKNLGRSALEPHEAGLRSLFDSVGQVLPPIFKRMKAAQIAFVKGVDLS